MPYNISRSELIRISGNWKLAQLIVWSGIFIVAFCFGISGAPVPRPFYVFAGVGISLLFIFLHIHLMEDEISFVELAVLNLSMFLTSYFLRWSMWARTLTASGDMVSHYSVRADRIIETGHIIDLGMSSHAPLVHIWIAINSLVGGIPLYDVRFIAVIMSSALPFLIGLFAYLLFNRTIGLYAIILAIPFPILFRTGAMFEPESLALQLFIMILYLLFKYILGEKKVSYIILFILVFSTYSYVHLLYPFIVLSFITSLLIIILSMRYLAKTNSFTRPRVDHIYLPTSGMLMVSLFHFYRTIRTNWGGKKLVLWPLQSSSIKMPNSIISFFLPQAGAVGESAGMSVGESASMSVNQAGLGPANRVALNSAPLIIFLLLGTIGAIYVFYTGFYMREERSLLLLILSVVVSMITIVAVAVFSGSETMRIGFRFYFFIGLLGIIHCSLAIEMILGKVYSGTPSDSLGSALFIFLLALFLVFAITGPASAIGNVVDPQFGGKSIAFTETMSYEFTQMDKYTTGNGRVDINTNMISMPGNNKGPFVPTANQSDGELHINSISQRCAHDQIWSGNNFYLCHK